MHNKAAGSTTAPTLTRRHLPNQSFLRTVTIGAAALYLSNAAIQAMMSFWQLGSPSILVFGALLLGVVVALATLRLRPMSIAFVVSGTAIFWTMISGSQPFSDFLGLYGFSAEFATTHSMDALAATKSTTTALLFGLWMDVAGTSIASARIAGALALGSTALFTALIGRHLGFPGFAWRFAGLAVGLSPGFLIYSPVVSTEAALVVTLMGAIYFFVTGYSNGPNAIRLASAGLLFGLAYLAVPTAGMFAIGATLVLAGRWAVHRSKGTFQSLAVLVIAMSLPLAAQVAINWQIKGQLSPSPSQWTAMAILQGTSVSCDGGWCPEDLELVGYFDAEVSKAEADSNALQLAKDRWLDDPVGITVFSVTAKQRELWSGESQLVHWSLYKSEKYDDWSDDGTITLLGRTTDAYYFATMALLVPAMAVVWRSRRFGWPETALAFGIAGSGLIHTLVSVQARYHLIYMPFVFLVIGLALQHVYVRRTPSGSS